MSTHALAYISFVFFFPFCDLFFFVLLSLSFFVFVSACFFFLFSSSLFSLSLLCSHFSFLSECRTIPLLAVCYFSRSLSSFHLSSLPRPLPLLCCASNIRIFSCVRVCVRAGGLACMRAGGLACVRAGWRACVLVCVRACVRAGVHKCVHACVSSQRTLATREQNFQVQMTPRPKRQTRSKLQQKLVILLQDR